MGRITAAARSDEMAKSETKPAALVVGVGPGLGAALVRRFAREGMGVAIAARRVDKLRDLAAETGGRAYACDATSEISVDDLFAAVEGDLGTPRLVVFNAGSFTRKPVVELTPAEVESGWRACCLGGFLVGRAAARAMLPGGPGTILLTGATAALRGGANFAAFAIGKFGLRALAQSMARELGPQGIHVGHVIIDGGIGTNAGESQLAPDAIADSYWHLHRQPKSAWTLELDLRPWVEKF
jgi:NAD(P)-dependent dehydrogenase (short-subunit alcohol dehydrogenase family)